jgi:zinc-ribbon domain
MKVYDYVGPDDIRRRVTDAPAGVRIAAVPDLLAWLSETKQPAGRDGLVPVTFVVDKQGNLLVADRGSEHVACAGGRSVLSAGEMFFGVNGRAVEVVEVTNQSTGYCPEPESWPVVAAALDRASIAHPGRFTQEVIFRRCPECGQRNIVKERWLVCGVCGADLPAAWNF